MLAFEYTVSESAMSGRIKHPTCYLWDAWSFEEAGSWYLYCLALPRMDAHGAPIHPDNRNDHRFHIRCFESHDKGRSWADHGVFQEPGLCANGADSGNVWSGDAFQTRSGDYWFASTGIRAVDAEHPFVQSLLLGRSADKTRFSGALYSVLGADTHYDQLVEAGYFLGPKSALGHCDGESGGSILALRDPFIVPNSDSTGSYDVVFAAKAQGGEPAMGHIRVDLSSSEPELIAVHAPIRLPDAAEFTQFEVPKVLWDAARSQYWLLGSTADRVDENQPEEDVNRYLRLYSAKTLAGPWLPASSQGSAIGGTGTRFGATIVGLQADELVCLAPLTTMDPEGGLYFDHLFKVDVSAERLNHTLMATVC